MRNTEKANGLGAVGDGFCNSTSMARFKWRLPMNPLGHMVSLTSSTDTTKGCGDEDISLLDRSWRLVAKEDLDSDDESMIELYGFNCEVLKLAKVCYAVVGKVCEW